jgi:hypothetical protein
VREPHQIEWYHKPATEILPFDLILAKHSCRERNVGFKIRGEYLSKSEKYIKRGEKMKFKLFSRERSVIIICIKEVGSVYFNIIEEDNVI